jgi:prephenate dehydrogenase
MKIAIVGGSGKMGSWFANFLVHEGNEVLLIGRNRERLQIIGSRLKVETSDNPQSVTHSDVVIISVPIDSFNSITSEYGHYINNTQTVIEITSVKVAPMTAMHRYLKTDKVLGMHPMFGPGAQDMAKHNFILTPTNTTEEILAAKVKSYIETRGGIVSIMSPEEHDKTMAIVLGLSHLLALVSADTLLHLGSFENLEKLGGTTCKLLLMLADSVLTEDPELYASLQMNIPGVVDLYKLLQNNLAKWVEIVSKKDRQGFIMQMQALSEQRKKTHPEFVKAYDEMYRTLEN